MVALRRKQGRKVRRSSFAWVCKGLRANHLRLTRRKKCVGFLRPAALLFLKALLAGLDTGERFRQHGNSRFLLCRISALGQQILDPLLFLEDL